jgi:hypothetical protein
MEYHIGGYEKWKEASMEYATVTAHAGIELKWQRLGLTRTASGYGSKLTTRHMVKVEGKRDIWRRVYAICYSNAASFFVIIDGKRVFIRDSDLEAL